MTTKKQIQHTAFGLPLGGITAGSAAPLADGSAPSSRTAPQGGHLTQVPSKAPVAMATEVKRTTQVRPQADHLFPQQ